MCVCVAGLVMGWWPGQTGYWKCFHTHKLVQHTNWLTVSVYFISLLCITALECNRVPVVCVQWLVHAGDVSGVLREVYRAGVCRRFPAPHKHGLCGQGSYCCALRRRLVPPVFALASVTCFLWQTDVQTPGSLPPVDLWTFKTRYKPYHTNWYILW